MHERPGALPKGVWGWGWTRAETRRQTCLLCTAPPQKAPAIKAGVPVMLTEEALWLMARRAWPPPLCTVISGGVAKGTSMSFSLVHILPVMRLIYSTMAPKPVNVRSLTVSRGKQRNGWGRRHADLTKPPSKVLSYGLATFWQKWSLPLFYPGATFLMEKEKVKINITECTLN